MFMCLNPQTVALNGGEKDATKYSTVDHVEIIQIDNIIMKFSKKSWPT